MTLTLLPAMLIISTIPSILFLLHGFLDADAAPVSSALFPRQTGTVPALSPDCICPASRSISDIVWSCLVTLFVCSWVSVHPNNAGPGEKWWGRTLRRLELMFWSIMTPELVAYWAMRQWAGARDLVAKYSEQGWTMTHGYFIQLGGFMLYDGDIALGVVGPDRLEYLLGKGMIVMPSVTEEDIQDRSKSDTLSKTLVVVQTSWFILQSIARRAEGLVITELEIVTIAFAALNGVMYFLWLHKPLDVQSTIPIYLNSPISPSQPPPAEGRPVELEAVTSERSSNGSVKESKHSEDTETKLEHPVSTLGIQICRNFKNFEFNFRDFPRQTLHFLSGVLFRWPVAGLFAIISRMGDISDSDTIDEGKMRVNTFYAYDPNPKAFTRGDFTTPFIGILFGAIHCAGWNYFFPSLAEAYIWRISSAVITGVPAVWMILILLLIWYHGDTSESLVLEHPLFVAILALVMIPLYFLARLALLIAPLISLRNLPSEAFGVVQWTSYLPHV